MKYHLRPLKVKVERICKGAVAESCEILFDQETTANGIVEKAKKKARDHIAMTPGYWKVYQPEFA